MTEKMRTTVKRQLAFVADLNKCIGCQNCTVACKNLWTKDPGQDYMYFRNVETKPGLGYPRNWAAKGGGFMNGELQEGKTPTVEDYGIPFEFDYQGRLFEGKPPKGRVAPKPEATWGPNWEDDVGSGDFPNNFYFYLPRMCNHCDQPACLDACPSDAIYKRAEDGLTVINLDKCDGSQDCVAACPYAKPYYNAKTEKANKCMGCFPRIEKGVAPACVAQCTGRAMHVGYLDDTKSSVHKLVKVFKVALPLYAMRGTKPNVYYVPPFVGPMVEDAMGNLQMESKVPLKLLEEMFGNEVNQALAVLRKERAQKLAMKGSELMDILIARRSADQMLNPLT